MMCRPGPLSAGAVRPGLDHALRDLLAQAPELEAAAVVSFDGLAMASALPSGHGRGPGRGDERRAALASARRPPQGLGRGDLSRSTSRARTAPCSWCPATTRPSSSPSPPPAPRPAYALRGAPRRRRRRRRAAGRRRPGARDRPPPTAPLSRRTERTMAHKAAPTRRCADAGLRPAGGGGRRRCAPARPGRRRPRRTSRPRAEPRHVGSGSGNGLVDRLRRALASWSPAARLHRPPHVPRHPEQEART